jgi:hypothetical protein
MSTTAPQVIKKESKALWWGAWTATFVSFIIGGAAAWGVAGPVRDLSSGLMAGAIAGVVIGVAQWLALQTQRAHLAASLVTRWAVVTTLGISIGVASGSALVNHRAEGADLAVMGFVTGLSVGALQAWTLRARVSASWRWLLLNPPLWAVSWLITWSIGVDVAARWAVFGAAGALFYTVITAFVLDLLLRERSSPAGATGAEAHARAEQIGEVESAEYLVEPAKTGGVS